MTAALTRALSMDGRFGATAEGIKRWEFMVGGVEAEAMPFSPTVARGRL